MLFPCYAVIGALLFLATPLLVSSQTCTAPGIPGIPGLPGRDGRNGEKGQKGESGAGLMADLGPQKGEKGQPGSVGYPGKQGQSGEPGDPGLQGSIGIPGEPGEAEVDVGAAGVQQQAAFSVARGTNDYPARSSVIRFTTIITNINDDYDVATGHFRCRVSGTYYFVFHASIEDRLCVLMKLDKTVLASFCDHRRGRRQVTAGSLAVYMSRNQELWLETKDYRGMRGKPAGYSIFSGFLLYPH